MSQVYSSKNYWIGYNDQESEGDWQWSDRVTSSFTNWDDDAPNNGGVTCAAFAEGGHWHDEPCSEKLPFICKRKGESKILPKTNFNSLLCLSGVSCDSRLLGTAFFYSRDRPVLPVPKICSCTATSLTTIRTYLVRLKITDAFSFSGPKGEKVLGVNDEGILKPLSRLLDKEDATRSELITKGGLKPG